ncbi:MAG: hypothetical protein K9H48_07915 [Melioribacteraceae bacterium]|nr:hypothetical protein [Melioribacteraceae bacterium]
MHQIEITRISTTFKLSQNSSYLNEAILIDSYGTVHRNLGWYYYYNYLMSLNNFLDKQKIIIFTGQMKTLPQVLNEENDIKIENRLINVILKQIIPNRFNIQIQKYCIVFHEEEKLKENMKSFYKVINLCNLGGSIRKSRLDLTEHQIKEKAKRMRNPKTNHSINHALLKWHALTAFQFGNNKIKSIFEKDMYKVI